MYYIYSTGNVLYIKKVVNAAGGPFPARCGFRPETKKDHMPEGRQKEDFTMEFIKKYSMLLNNLTVQKNFTTIASKCISDVKAVSEEEDYCVDAKSVLGFYSLDLNRPVTITVNNEADARVIEQGLRERDIDFAVVSA